MAKRKRPIELLLWGATGFTGKLAAEWLAKRYADARVALGGRNQKKLEALRDELAAIDPKCAAWPIRVADGLDVPALDKIVPEASSVAALAGPFAIHGRELAAACARHGTDYCDITGEVPFARELIDRNDARAKESGARLVPFCGFDSIPSDLGVFALQKYANAELGAPCASATFVLVRARGGVSGGTAASAMNLMEVASRDHDVAKMMSNPYALADGGGPSKDARGAKKLAEGWTAPFFMDTVNSRVVHRTNALLGYPYGRDFRYEERMVVGRGASGFVRAAVTSAGLAIGPRALAIGPIRSLAKRLIPAPGEGPRKEDREGGSFDVHVVGRNARGEIVATCKVSGAGDPGYTGAAKMVVESALCLSRDVEGPGGVTTPAAAMGDALVRRLREAGIVIDVTSG
ncbi:MAG TPA: saccharopine dehydrogenase NADP-binding domain-containing protein [Polyangiaceae bacterium]|jgi:short subunit dehydrogenase-like uncharacterized protein|nr:saccharopine dehydrogenase NADP-binding domain-containing protein [Polyangiaceae bacterium]